MIISMINVRGWLISGRMQKFKEINYYLEKEIDAQIILETACKINQNLKSCSDNYDIYAD